MPTPTPQESEFYAYEKWLYSELEEIRDPPFYTLFKIVFKVLAASLIIEIIIFMCVLVILGVLGSSLLAILGHLLQSIHILQPTIQPYNFVIPLYQVLV